MWIQTGVTVRKRLSWVMTSVTLTFDLWPCPFAWTSFVSLVITSENSMVIQWWEHSQKGVMDRETDRQTEWAIHRAALVAVKKGLGLGIEGYCQYNWNLGSLKNAHINFTWKSVANLVVPPSHVSFTYSCLPTSRIDYILWRYICIQVLHHEINLNHLKSPKRECPYVMLPLPFLILEDAMVKDISITLFAAFTSSLILN